MLDLKKKRQNKFWGLRHIIIHSMRYRQLAVMHYLLCNRQMTPQIELPTTELTPQAGSCALSTTQLSPDSDTSRL